MLLADSEYRHELEADLAPFKGLLLGLFFIAVGMSVNIGLMLKEPMTILLFVVGLMVAKAIVLYPLARAFGLCNTKGALSLAAVLSQGGEFAFVLFALVAREQIIDTTQIDRLILAVVVSMMLTPVVYLIIEHVTGRAAEKDDAEYDGMEDEGNAVIIAGFGRVGQIVGRLLRVKGQSFTALEIDSSQVDVVRRYGSKVHFGDAGRLDLLRAAGADRAKYRRYRSVCQNRRDHNPQFSSSEHYRPCKKPPACPQADGSRYYAYLPRDIVIQPGYERACAGNAWLRPRGSQARH
jgi:hypothetical protein